MAALKSSSTLSEDKYLVTHYVSQTGIRLDAFLKDRYRKRSREVLKRAIDEGHIFLRREQSPHLTSGRLKASTHLIEGDEVQVLSERHPEPEVSFDYKILFEDEVLLVINKPANLPVHPAGRYFFNTLLIHLRTHGHKDPLKAEREYFLAHRIDKETSGVLILTKDREVCAHLVRQFSERSTEKHYLAIVHGTPPEEFEIDAALRRTTHSQIELKMMVAPEEEGGAPSSGVGGGGGGGGGTSQPTTAAVTLPVPTPVPAAPSVHEPAPAPSAEQLTLSEEAAIAPGEEAAPVPSTAERAALAGRAFFQGAAGIGRYWILFAVFFLVVLVSFVTLSLLRREYRTLPGVIKTPKVLPLEYPLKKGEIISRTGKKVLSLEAEFAQISGQLDRLRQVEIDRPRVRMTVPATVGHSTESLLLKERWQQHHKSITSLLQKSIQKPNVLLQHLRPKKISKKILLAEKKAAQQVRHIDAKLKHGTSGNELLRIEDEITKLKKQLKKERKNFNE